MVLSGSKSTRQQAQATNGRHHEEFKATTGTADHVKDEPGIRGVVAHIAVTIPRMSTELMTGTSDAISASAKSLVACASSR